MHIYFKYLKISVQCYYFAHNYILFQIKSEKKIQKNQKSKVLCGYQMQFFYFSNCKAKQVSVKRMNNLTQ